MAIALRELREQAGLSLEVAAREALEASAAKLSRVETGRQTPGARDVRDLCRLYRVTEARTAELLTWAASAREPAWWESFEINDDDYVGLESAATQIREFQPYFIPALLQTDDYAEAVIRASIVPGRLGPWDAAGVKEMLEIRSRRRVLIDPESGVSSAFVVDEAALLRAVGVGTMLAQIRHLVEATDGANVDLRILPLKHGATAGLSGGFSILSLPNGPDVGYVESQAGSHMLDEPDDLERLGNAFRSVQSASLDAQGSKDALERAMVRLS